MDPELGRLLAFSQTKTWLSDQIGTTEGLRRWFAAHGLLTPGETVSETDVRRARHFRAAIAGLLRESAGGAPDPRTRPVLDAVMQAAPLRVAASEGARVELVPGGTGIDRALATLLAELYRAGVTGEIRRLKVCPGCNGTFYDTSKNRSKIWCEMAKCGSQRKSRMYRERQAQAEREGRHSG
ncbi:MAG: CGNR zinc finger domain-containing protein [Chloroflexi bacterium]|nr:CGNR zinc finger domain-containing protein [Chloroflexota bacterium]